MMSIPSINRRAFTLVELVVVMGIFISILVISASAFESVLKVSSRLMKSSQSQMEGVVGLEILRKDLNSAGYGLPWSFEVAPNPANYREAAYGADKPIKGLGGDTFNDYSAGTIKIPRAVVLGTVPSTQATIYQTKDLAVSSRMNANPGSDYLVIKSVIIPLNDSVGKWGFVNFSGSSTLNSSYIAKNNSAEDLVANEVVITHVNTFSGTNRLEHQLAMEDADNFSYKLQSQNSNGNFVPPADKYKPSGAMIDPFGSKIPNESLIVYALTGSESPVRMPFNRADYYIKRPTTDTIPERCNPGTGVLYKSVISNKVADAETEYPLLDCVGDMQVVFDLQDPANAAVTISSDTLATLDAAAIRGRLKAIRVYLLVQEGGMDKKYQYPISDPANVISVSDARVASLGRTFSSTDMENFFGPDWRNYRWRVYSVVGQPYNLLY